MTKDSLCPNSHSVVNKESLFTDFDQYVSKNGNENLKTPI